MPWSRVVTFTDPLACEAALQSTARAEIIPVGRGRVHIEATQIGMDKLRMQRFKVPLQQISTVEASPDRKSIGFLLEASSPSLQHCGLKVAPNDIIIYGHGLPHQRSEADFQYGTLSVPAQDFPVLFATIIGQEFREGPRTFIVRPDPALMSRLSYMEWSDLLWPATSRCELAGPKLCGLLIGDIDDREAAEILGDIGIPTFAEVQFAAGLVSTESLAQVFIYSRGEDEHARLLHLRYDCPGQRPTGLKPLFGVITDPLLVEVDNVVRHVISCYLRPEEHAPVDHRYFACSACGPKRRSGDVCYSAAAGA